MTELKISKEQVLKASKECPDAKKILETLFPEVFKTKREDVTSQMKWKLYRGETSGYYYLEGYYNEDFICWADSKGVHIRSDWERRFETLCEDFGNYYPFKIIKKGD